MTNTRQIESARQHLAAGNRYAYAAIMSGAIRSAMSDRSANAFRKAIAADSAADLFVNLSTASPLAKKEA